MCPSVSGYNHIVYYYDRGNEPPYSVQEKDVLEM